MPNYYPRRVNPADSLLFDAAGHLVGLRSGTSGQEEIFGLSAPKMAAFDSLVSGAGNPTDLLTAPLQHVTITGALSTTVTQAAAATGTYTKARVVWNKRPRRNLRPFGSKDGCVRLPGVRGWESD